MACPECDRLWRLYANATREHLAAVQMREVAVIGGDINMMRATERALEAAAEERNSARSQVTLHEASHSK